MSTPNQTAAFLSALILLAMTLSVVSQAAAVQSPEPPDPSIRITEQSGTLTLNISYRVPVAPRQAWEVLTDFEHMAEFVPNLDSSQVLQKTARNMLIEQKGHISLGMLPIPYQSKRQIDLMPYQTIRSHALSGNTRLDSVMVLTPSGNGTMLTYSATAVPDLPVPSSMFSTYMGEMLEHQFKAMGREMIKRAAVEDKSEDEVENEPIQETGRPTAATVSPPSDKPLAGKQAATQVAKKQPQNATKPAKVLPPPDKSKTQTKKRPD